MFKADCGGSKIIHKFHSKECKPKDKTKYGEDSAFLSKVVQ